MRYMMRLFSSKKAAHDFFSMLWEKLVDLFVAFALIFVPLLAFVLFVTSSDYFERNYLSMDLALVDEAILTSPNDLIYYYDKNMKDFSFKVDENKIEIKKLLTKASSNYINNPSLNIGYIELIPITEKVNKREKIIPIKLSITNIRKNVNYQNLKETLLEDKDQNTNA